MTDQTHTIKMKKEYLDRWLEGLRGGKFEQTTEYLHDGQGYCCLGVLQIVVSGEIVKDMVEDSELPNEEWLEEHGIEFHDDDGNVLDPLLPEFGCSASQANDEGKSFKDIADAIEKTTITY